MSQAISDPLLHDLRRSIPIWSKSKPSTLFWQQCMSFTSARISYPYPVLPHIHSSNLPFLYSCTFVNLLGLVFDMVTMLIFDIMRGYDEWCMSCCMVWLLSDGPAEDLTISAVSAIRSVEQCTDCYPRNGPHSSPNTMLLPWVVSLTPDSHK
jgi:hypothetical protein